MQTEMAQLTFLSFWTSWQEKWRWACLSLQETLCIIKSWKGLGDRCDNAMQLWALNKWRRVTVWQAKELFCFQEIYPLNYSRRAVNTLQEMKLWLRFAGLRLRGGASWGLQSVWQRWQWLHLSCWGMQTSLLDSLFTSILFKAAFIKSKLSFLDSEWVSSTCSEQVLAILYVCSLPYSAKFRQGRIFVPCVFIQKLGWFECWLLCRL